VGRIWVHAGRTGRCAAGILFRYCNHGSYCYDFHDRWCQLPCQLPAAGQIIVTTSGATRFAIVQSNTSATNSVLTIDRWYDATAIPADPGVAAASTPTAGAWAVVAGGAPAAYMALANNATAVAPAATDTALTGEITTASGGLIRKLATYAHTAASGGAGTTTLTKTWTANGPTRCR
jgi:hypothetical protein